MGTYFAGSLTSLLQGFFWKAISFVGSSITVTHYTPKNISMRARKTEWARVLLLVPDQHHSSESRWALHWCGSLNILLSWVMSNSCSLCFVMIWKWSYFEAAISECLHFPCKRYSSCTHSHLLQLPTGLQSSLLPLPVFSIPVLVKNKSPAPLPKPIPINPTQPLEKYTINPLKHRLVSQNNIQGSDFLLK